MHNLSFQSFFEFLISNTKAFRLRFTLILSVFLVSAGVVNAVELRVMKTGLGNGTITSTSPESPKINCGNTCTQSFSDGTEVTLRVEAPPGSTFVEWGGACSGISTTCGLTMGDATKSVRAKLSTDIEQLADNQLNPDEISGHLTKNASINSPATFVAALPDEFKQNWIMMPRSESLQIGTAELPRILLISNDAKNVFTLGLAGPKDQSKLPLDHTDPHSSYPGSHPNAIEYMQWDESKKNFRFHEIVVADIPALGHTYTNTNATRTIDVRRFPARTRGVTVDDVRCFACHSTRNVFHEKGRQDAIGTAQTRAGLTYKSKPNWDAYDSWGGMLAFNRDRIYKGSVEAAAFRKLLNLWTWQNNDDVRKVIEQLKLQPVNPSTITRLNRDDENDGHIKFTFDKSDVVTTEPAITSETSKFVSYSFDRKAGANPSEVYQHGTGNDYVTLHQPPPNPNPDEGRGVAFFDQLSGFSTEEHRLRLNAQRIVNELINHEYATGSHPIDVRPIALAIVSNCITVSDEEGGTNNKIISVPSKPDFTIPIFFEKRNGLSFNKLYDDTRWRAQSLTRRKADNQRTTLDRANDTHVYSLSNDGYKKHIDGLINEYGKNTASGTNTTIERIRQEVFRRPVNENDSPDQTVMGGIYVDREIYTNTAPVALYRFFLEPLGVSVDKWSTNVRGRSRAYNFADVFSKYTSTFKKELEDSLNRSQSSIDTCDDIMALVKTQFDNLPDTTDLPTYTDIQRIFNKACIECHNDFGYPPYASYGGSNILTENEDPPQKESRLWKPYETVKSRVGYIKQRITNDNKTLDKPYSPTQTIDNNGRKRDLFNEECPNGIMPCEGPPLSNVDIQTIVRWANGATTPTYSEGDPHIKTINGKKYDFQSVGEFVLLRGVGMELQARHSAVTTERPLWNAYTGLDSCVSVNTAVAMRVGRHRVTYQPEIKQSDLDVDYTGADNITGDLSVARTADNKEPTRLILRVDGDPVDLGKDGFPLSGGGRIVPTSVPNGIEVHYPGGTSVVVTPGFWNNVWHLNIKVNHARVTNGLMGSVPRASWLPALSDGRLLLGPPPKSPEDRYSALYRTFANSWRVTEEDSLFDYELGLSPDSFVNPDWPPFNAKSCIAPPQVGIPYTETPPPPIPEEEAKQLCDAITDPDRKNNCIIDTMATGARVMAQTYLNTQKIEQRFVPQAPILDNPENFSTLDPQLSVNFTWKEAPGNKDVDITYRHCIWDGYENYDFNKCIKLDKPTHPLVDQLPSELTKHLTPTLCIIVVVLLLLIALWLFTRGNKRKLALFVFLLALILAAICFLIEKDRDTKAPLSTSVPELKPGMMYSWKVIAETKEGVTTESETRRFIMK